MRWSEAVTLEFVKIYLKHECLWNPSHSGYRLKYQREKAYSSITSEFQGATSKCLSVPEVKLKIKNLRTTYMQQVNKILQKSSPDAIYEPSLVWFNEMDQCLKHVPSHKHSSSYNHTQEVPELDSSCQIWVDQELQKNNSQDSNSDPLIPQSEDGFDSTELDQTIEKINNEKSILPHHYRKIKKKKIKHRPKDYYLETVKEDEFDIYGKYIASQLRKMDLRNALKLKLEIHSLISEARISDI